jgi:hypothetical protein
MIRTIAALTVATLALASPLVAAQQPSDICAEDRWHFETAAESLRVRHERLCKEIASQREEWAGRYHTPVCEVSYDSLIWAPGAGFLLFSAPDSPWVERASYGAANLSGGLLRLRPEVPIDSSRTFGSEFHCVRWGESHWLIPPDQVIAFCYAVNSGAPEELCRFLKKSLDPEPPKIGMPIVPAAYRKYLGIKPIRARIRRASPPPRGPEPTEEQIRETLAWYDRLSSATITLAAGAAERVRPGMKLWHQTPNGYLVGIRIVVVKSHSSEARVEGVEALPSAKGEVLWPKAGWTFVDRVVR